MYKTTDAGKLILPARLAIVLTFFLLSSCAAPIESTGVSQTTIFHETFAYRDSPIHPGVIREFEGWMSDGGPITVAVDIAAAHGSDEYLDADVIDGPNGWIAYRPSERERFAYRWLGRLDRGVHVVQTSSSGGGSGRFINLQFLQLKTDLAFLPDGRPTERLVLSVFRWYPMGDRVYGPVLLDGNTVVIGPGPKITEPIRLDIELPH